MKNIEKLDEYQNYNHNIDEQINDLELTIANYEQVKHQFENELKLNNEQLNKLYKQLKQVDDSLDCELLDKQEILNDIELFYEKLNKFTDIDFDNQIEELYNANINLSTKLSSSNNDLDLDELYELKNEITEKIQIAKNKLLQIGLDFKNGQKNIPTIIQSLQSHKQDHRWFVFNIDENQTNALKLLEENSFIGPKIPETHKTCKICKYLKELSEFYIQKNKREN